MVRALPKKIVIGVAMALSAGVSVPAAAVDRVAPVDWTTTLRDYATMQQQRYLVQFEDAPLALYEGDIAGLPAAPAARSRSGRAARIDVNSAQARRYLGYLQQRQEAALGSLRQAVSRPLSPLRTMQHALNAVLLELTPEEALRIARVPGVKRVAVDELRQLATDISAPQIGADNVWRGLAPDLDRVFGDAFDSTAGNRGEGAVVGIIDSGIDPGSPSFAAVEDGGYTFTNPLGAGTYLGNCRSGQALAGRCNDKLIGIYEFITQSGVATTAGLDDNGHGSHVASTAAGNNRSASYFNFVTRISGVAPHASVVAYKSCSAAGSCSTADVLAALNQAVADGVVDVINVSIQGGVRPWATAEGDAYRAAANAGIVVATAAGNTNVFQATPLPGSVNHADPWKLTVTAGTQSASAAPFLLVAQGSGAPAPIAATPGPNQNVTAALPATALALSPTFDQAGDACDAFAAGTFAGKVALLRYSGRCGTATMATNAQNAGATAIVLAHNLEEPLASGATTTAIVYGVARSAGDVLAAYAQGNAGAQLATTLPQARGPGQADQLAGFALRGPTPWNLLKPDLQMPGVDVLAAGKADANGSAADRVLLMSGTSMAAPHAAGAAALLRAANPGWTPMEIKSALMMTAREDSLSGVGGSGRIGHLERGSGRGQVDAAVRAGLVLDETSARMASANPYATPAPLLDAAALNLASLVQTNCVTPAPDGATSAPRCLFQRTFRSTVDRSVSYSASLATPAAGISLQPATLSVAAGAQQVLTVTVENDTLSSGLQSNSVVLTPDDPHLPTLHLPLLVAVQPPAAAKAPATLALQIPAGQPSASADLSLGNAGGRELLFDNLAYVDAQPHALAVLDQLPYFGISAAGATWSSGGFHFSGYQSFLSLGGGVSRVSAQLLTSGPDPAGLYETDKFHFWIYADNNGAPAGSTDGTGAAPLWEAHIDQNSAALAIAPALATGADQIYSISLDAAHADVPAPPLLPPGRYWMSVAREGNVFMAAILGRALTRWMSAPEGSGVPAYAGVAAAAAVYADSPGLALKVEQSFGCSASLPGISTSANSLSIGGGATRTLTFTATRADFPPGQSEIDGYVCLHSNDPVHPVFPVRVRAVAQ